MTELVKSYLELLSFSVLAAFLLAYLLTPVCIRLGFLLGMVDQPDERRVHKTPTPRSGGIGLFLAFAGTLYLISSQLTFPQLGAGAATWISQVLPVCILVLVLGIADDRWEISPWVKLLGQIVIGILAWMQGLHLGQLLGMTFHPVLDATCTTFLFVAAMNAYNLIDGMDGIAGGLGCITAFGLCGLQVLQGNEGMAAVCVALAGACLGFLRYNFHPARIFLGDTGSMLIGFVLMAVTMAANNRSAALVMLVVPLLTMGIPMIDTALAIWRRSVRRAINPSSTGVSTADKDHLHHRLARRGFTQRKVAVLLYAMQALVFLIGLSWLFLRDYRTAIFSIAFLVGSYVLLRYLASLEMSDSGQWIVDGIRKPGGMQLYNSLMPFMDGMILSLALVAFSWLLSPNYPALQLNRLLRESAAPIIGCPLILIWLTRYYRPHWTRARALDYFYILVITSSGVLIGFALSPLSFKHDLRETLTFVILLMALTTPAMTFLRAFPRLVQDLVHYHERNRNSSHEEHGRIRTLVYGAGYGYTLMVRAESFSKPEERRTYQLLGLIDDDPYLRGRLIHGHTVLGGIEDLPTLVEQKEVDELILSTTLEPERLDKVMQIAEEKNLRVRESVFRNNTLREPGQ